MTTPDLGDQLTRILASLEKATPQVLDLATKTMRQEAVANGFTMLLCLLLCAVGARRIWQWLQSDRAEEAEEAIRAAAYFALIAFGIVALILVVNIPDQVTKFTNARYYAIADLLARVKP